MVAEVIMPIFRCLKCPTDSGGCGLQAWRVAIDPSCERAILRCKNCDLEINLPLAMGRMQQYFTGLLDLTGDEIRTR